MSSQREKPDQELAIPEGSVKFDIDTLRDVIDRLTEKQVSKLLELIRRREVGLLHSKIDPLPDLAHNEFKIFDNQEDKKVTDKVLDIRKRRYLSFVHYCSNFEKPDDNLISFIQFISPGLSYIQAARDLNKVKSIFNNIHRIRRELTRYQVIEMHKKAYQVAETNEDPIGMASAANGITKAAMLDKDIAEVDWDKMIAPSFEPSMDLEVLGEGFEKKTNVEADIIRMRKKFEDIDEATLV